MKFQQIVILLLLFYSITFPQSKIQNEFKIERDQTSASDTSVSDIRVRNSAGEIIFQISDEADGASLFLKPVPTISDPVNKLYNINNTLHWNNVPIGDINFVNRWIISNSNLLLSDEVQYLGIGTDNPLHKLHIEGGNILVKGNDNWFPGITIQNEVGRSVLNLQGTTSPNNFRSSEIILSDLTNNNSWSILNTESNRLIFVSQSGNDFKSPLQLDFSAPTNSLTINSSGNIGIGVWSNEHKLAVAGSIISEEVVVKLQSNWPDYVFSDSYELQSLTEIEKYIQENQHLRGVPSADEIKSGGINIAEIQIMLLEKIEELTLYTIEQQKSIIKLENEIKKLKESGEKE